MIMEGCSTGQWTQLDALLSELVFLKTFKEKKNLSTVNCGLEDSKERTESMRSSLTAIMTSI